MMTGITRNFDYPHSHKNVAVFLFSADVEGRTLFWRSSEKTVLFSRGMVVQRSKPKG